MNWSRMHTTIAGVGLIVVVNAVALLGAAYNRSGEPESVLRLSERGRADEHKNCDQKTIHDSPLMKVLWQK